MPCEEVSAGAVWRTAPELLQHMRQFYLAPCNGTHARRCLFGQTDREEIRKFVKEELAAIRQSERDKYNFDFENMQPLEGGRFEWKTPVVGEVSPAYEMARLQRGLQCRSARRLDFDAPRPVRPVTPDPGQVTPDVDTLQPSVWRPEDRRVPQSVSPTSAEVAEERTAESPAGLSEPFSRTHPPRQTKLTDFWRSRKRPSAFARCDVPASKRPATAAVSSATAATTAATAADSTAVEPASSSSATAPASRQ